MRMRGWAGRWGRRSLVSRGISDIKGCSLNMGRATDRIDRVALSKPLVPDKDKSAVERRIFPSEVSYRISTSHPEACEEFPML